MSKGGNKPWKDFFDAHESNSLQGRTFDECTRAKPATSATTSRSQTPLAASSTGPPSQKVQNEAYFARMGAENAHRPDTLPPNQGGKYAGFGSEPMPSSSSNSTSIPGVDDFQKDPVAALTKGFGWLSSTVTKQAKTGYDGWVKPNMQKVCCRDK